jgi:hypothetical protein
MPKTDLKTLEEIFRAQVFKMLKKKEKITDEIITNLMGRRHSGFRVHNAVRVARDDHEAREKDAKFAKNCTLFFFIFCNKPCECAFKGDVLPFVHDLNHDVHKGPSLLR